MLLLYNLTNCLSHNNMIYRFMISQKSYHNKVNDIIIMFYISVYNIVNWDDNYCYNPQRYTPSELK